jgi:anti-anti-sigma factor
VSYKGFAPGFRIETGQSEGVREIKAFGELDSGTCDALLEAFEQAIASPGHEAVSLDLQAVSFIDSSGMRTMIQVERDAKASGIHLTVVPPPEDVIELLRTAGIAERMNLAGGATATGSLGADFFERVNLELDREPSAPSRARGEVREALGGRLDEAEVATVVLLTSELVTNAVIHPKNPPAAKIGLGIYVHEDGVRVEVEDEGDGFDPSTPTVSSAHGGRGLFLVDRCSSSWGTRKIDSGRFCVWFEFAGSDREAATVNG